MRALLIGAGLALAVTGHAAASPTDRQLLDQVRSLDSKCRGLPPGEDDGACQKRDQIVGRLTERGYCYGLKGQVGADMRWHRCGPRSERLEDQP